jgi:hypothetical protein
LESRISADTSSVRKHRWPRRLCRAEAVFPCPTGKPLSPRLVAPGLLEKIPLVDNPLVDKKIPLVDKS